MKYRLTTEERRIRRERRAEQKQAAADRVQNLRDWRDERSKAATKAAKKRAKQLRSRPRGVDRVPDEQRDLYVSVEPVLLGKRGTRLAQPEDLHPAGNYRTRRARGQRGKQRPRRLREMPGAEARRLERARKEWLS